MAQRRGITRLAWDIPSSYIDCGSYGHVLLDASGTVKRKVEGTSDDRIAPEYAPCRGIKDGMDSEFIAMQFKLTFVAILSTVVAAVNGAAIASPVIEARANQTTQAAQVDGHVFICTDGGFAGDCTNWGFTAGVCSTFTSEFQDDISSIGPDQGWSCNAYSDFFCNDDEGHIVVQNPGYAHLGDLGWNDKISSILCTRI